jgi:O-antigen/teichoic acid export membrane protein
LPSDGILDLTQDPAEPKIVSSGLATVREQPYDPSKDREKIRGMIALILTICLIAIVLFTLIMILTGVDIEKTKDTLELILSPVVGLVGAVTGFYFGEKQK